MGVACCANYPASQSILPHSQTVTMLLCREQLYLAPNHTTARPSKTQGRATQDIQSSIHSGRANPTRSAFQRAHSQKDTRNPAGRSRKPWTHRDLLTSSFFLENSGVEYSSGIGASAS